MISQIIRGSIENRFLVIVGALFLAVAGVISLRSTPLDAIPDLSDVQVIIKTSYPGQAPQVVEDQVTYPLATAMLAVPGAKTVRGYSFFNDSYVYIIFEDGTDLYWARSRVLEYLSQVAPQLPEAAKPALGPDAALQSACRILEVCPWIPADRLRHHAAHRCRELRGAVSRGRSTRPPGFRRVRAPTGLA